jgi:flavodoxin
LFYVDSDDSIRYNIAIPGGPPQLFSDIEAEYYGVMGVIEPELRLSETIALVTRLAGGVYSYDFDGRFGGAGTATVSDSENGVGVRAEGLLGLKLFLSSAFSLTFFGGADYWSETPIANFPETLGTTAFIDRTHMVKLKAGITATVAFGGQ